MEKSAQCQEAGLDGAGGKRASRIRQRRLQKEAGTDGAGCQEIDGAGKSEISNGADRRQKPD